MNKGLILFFSLMVFAVVSSIANDFNQSRGANLLIITEDRFYNTLHEFAQWKHKKGYLTKIVKLSEIGDRKPELIRDYINNAYYGWEIIPEYILLVGDINYLPPYPHPNVGASDNPYGDVNGDTLLEMCVGRLPARTKRQLQSMIAKILRYERRVDLTDTMFYKRALTIRQDPGPYHNAGVNFVRAMILNNSDFVQVDTLYNPAHNHNDVRDSLKQGRSYLFYTGHGAGTHWPEPFKVCPYLNNKNKTPIILSWSCQTVLQPRYLGQKWLKAGNVRNPRGAVAYLGTTTSGLYARYRNFVGRNFFRAIFQNKVINIGQALKQGLDSLWQFTPDSFGHILYSEWNLLGDPTMSLWTGVPKPMIIQHDTIINASPQTFTVMVRNEQGEPIVNAWVCISAADDDNFYYLDKTDSFGNVSFLIEPSNIDSIWITVTSQNYLAYEKSCRVSNTKEMKTRNSSQLSNQMARDPDLIIYPNPAKSVLYVKTELPLQEVKILDLSGNVIKIQKLKSSNVFNIRLDVNEIKAGVYFVNIKTESNNLIRRLIVLK